jgi:hypothetical protein
MTFQRACRPRLSYCPRLAKKAMAGPCAGPQRTKVPESGSVICPKLAHLTGWKPNHPSEATTCPAAVLRVSLPVSRLNPQTTFSGFHEPCSRGSRLLRVAQTAGAPSRSTRNSLPDAFLRRDRPGGHDTGKPPSDHNSRNLSRLLNPSHICGWSRSGPGRRVACIQIHTSNTAVLHPCLPLYNFRQGSPATKPANRGPSGRLHPRGTFCRCTGK